MSDSFETPWSVTRQVPLSIEFFRQEYWSGLPFPPSGDLPNLRIEPAPPRLAGVFFTTEPLSAAAPAAAAKSLVVSNSVRPHRQQPTRLPHPWDSPGTNTAVGCPFLLQCMKVKSLSRVQLLATPGLQPTTLLCPWDFPSKSTGVGCHRLLWNLSLGKSKIHFILF